VELSQFFQDRFREFSLKVDTILQNCSKRSGNEVQFNFLIFFHLHETRLQPQGGFGDFKIFYNFSDDVWMVFTIQGEVCGSGILRLSWQLDLKL